MTVRVSTRRLSKYIFGQTSNTQGIFFHPKRCLALSSRGHHHPSLGEPHLVETKKITFAKCSCSSSFFLKTGPNICSVDFPASCRSWEMTLSSFFVFGNLVVRPIVPATIQQCRRGQLQRERIAAPPRAAAAATGDSKLHDALMQQHDSAPCQTRDTRCADPPQYLMLFQ